VPLKVLLADDNITAQRMGSKILSDAGYIVVPVSNGAAAVKKIASEKPELIILDVYMPGYTGLEVCDKVKSAAETAHVPVLLTVTNMEPFNPEDGNRVKADGVLVKPFEATDLLAVVRKLEGKLHPPRDADTTIKMSAVQDFSDQSYADWKAEVGLGEEAEAKPAEMPHDSASEPALGIEELAPAPGAPPAWAIESSPAPFAIDSQPAEATAFDPNAPEPAFDLQHAEPPVESAPVIAPPPAELEFTSAPQTGAMEVAPAAELEPTVQAGGDEVPVVQDSALVTDQSDFAQFATRFGEEHPEDIPVGIAQEEKQPAHDDAMEEEQLVRDDAIAEIHEFVSEPGPVAEASNVEQEMRQAFETSGGAAAAVAPAPEPGPEPEAGVHTEPLDIFPEPQPAADAEIEAAPEPEHAPGEITQKLVAQFAAELEAAQKEAPPEPQLDLKPPGAAASTPATMMDERQISAAVDRVLERYKGELIAAIVRELKG
jgi:CheY-like chemotaxis protein